METDRELLEFAAKAAGYEYRFNKSTSKGPYWIRGRTGYLAWNPLTNDGDALRLAVKLEINIRFEAWKVIAERFLIPSCNVLEHLTMGYSVEEAIRRAVTRAAAEIGKGMK